MGVNVFEKKIVFHRHESNWRVGKVTLLIN
jgi:hypothetical protein